jgi:hypothetical protein
MSNIFIYVKNDLFGCFTIEEIREKDNEIGLKERRVIKIETAVLHSRAAPSLCVDLPRKMLQKRDSHQLT